MFNRSVYAGRRKRLLEKMPGQFALVIPPATPKPSSADAEFPYVPNKNLVYLTGIDQQGTWLVIHRKKGGDIREDLFIAPYDEVREKWIGSVLTVEEAGGISGVENVSFNTAVEEWIDRLLNKWGITEVRVDYPVGGLTGHRGGRQGFVERLLAAYPHLAFKRLSPEIFRLRMVKEPGELEKMRRAIDITARGFSRALRRLRPGMREYEFEAEMLYEFMLKGEKTPAFPPIVAGGERATCLHYSKNDEILEEGTLLLVDFGASTEFYNADVSRTVPVNGGYTPRQRELVEMVLEVQEEAIRLLRPGKLYSRWNAEVKEFYASMLLERKFTDSPEEIGKYYYHNIGHHIGLDTHDENVSGEELRPGMVLTVEPGFYSREEGVGIRIEDDVLIGENGNEILTAGIPRTPDEIEDVMRGK